MRSILFLLVGIGLMLLVGALLTGTPGTPETAMAEPEHYWQRTPSFTPEWILLLAAWATAFVIRPGWLCFLLTVAVILVGGLYAVLGGLAWSVWDIDARPDYTVNRTYMWFGIWMLLSRLVTAWMLLRKTARR